MGEPIRVLIIEDDSLDAGLMVRELERAGFLPEWIRVETEDEYLAALEQSPDVILSDSKLPLFDGFEALDVLNRKGLAIPFILVSGRVGEDLAVEAMKRGACDYLLKDRLARLGEAVRRAIELRRMSDERAWAIEALRRSEERYRLVSEVSSDYAYSLRIDSDGTLDCEWITDSFTRITGFTAGEVNLRGWTSLYHADDLSVSRRHYETLTQGQPDSVEIRVVRKDGRVRWLKVHDRPVQNAQTGRVDRIYGAAQDLTIQKQMEDQLLQAGKMEAIGQLAGGVAHDFNNLLTVIWGYCDLFKKQTLNATASGYLDEILEATARASDLTRQLLAFGRGQTFELKNLNLDTVIAGMGKLLARLIGEDVELRILTNPGHGLVRADPGQVERVVMNLAVNARDAMPKGGKLTIETSNVELDQEYADHHAKVEPGAYVMLAVSDTGIGMAKETASRIFEPFFTTKGTGKGTGLGLAMVYGIVKQSGGDIRVYSEPGRGTTFKIYLPRLTEGKETEADPTPFLLRSGQGSETVLVLEDDNSLRTLIRQVLIRKGYEVLDTGDPHQAIRICDQYDGEIALLITDVILPKMSGPQVAEQALELRPNIKVLYTSGYTANALLHHGVQQQQPTFVEKPFTPDVLARKVREVLDTPSVASELPD
jgi:PAS domain S-box-containing protein